MLQLALELPDYTIIYNGAKCGASAPDHFHFQAVPQGIMPIETEFTDGKNTISCGHLRNCAIYTWRDYLRRPLTIRGNNPETLSWLFKRLNNILQNTSGTAEEPMMNMLMHYNQGKWTVHIFLRSRHRPDQYYADAEKQLMLSPASIDMGGFMIIPREKDFELITPEIAKDVYNQVCIDEKTLDIVVKNLLES
jgi:hypothetical protein